MRIIQNGSPPQTVSGNQVAIHHAASPGSIDRPRVFVLNTSGDLRINHPDLDGIVAARDKPSATVTLPPLLWVDDAQPKSTRLPGREGHQPRYRCHRGCARKTDPLRRRRPTLGSGVALPGANVQWKIIVPRTTPQAGQVHQDVTAIQIEVNATFNQQVVLNRETHQDQAEGFRAAVIRTSNVPDFV